MQPTTATWNIRRRSRNWSNYRSTCSFPTPEVGGRRIPNSRKCSDKTVVEIIAWRMVYTRHKWRHCRWNVDFCRSERLEKRSAVAVERSMRQEPFVDIPSSVRGQLIPGTERTNQAKWQHAISARQTTHPCITAPNARDWMSITKNVCAPTVYLMVRF